MVLARWAQLPATRTELARGNGLDRLVVNLHRDRLSESNVYLWPLRFHHNVVPLTTPPAPISFKRQNNKQQTHHNKTFVLLGSMFYLYDLATYSKNYGSISHPDDNEEGFPEDALKPTSAWDNGEYSEDWKYWDDRRRQHGPQERLLNVDEAIQSLGMGIFQYRIVVVTGLLLAVDSMEMVILTYLSKVYVENSHWKENWPSDWSPDLISWIVFPSALVGALVWGILGDAIGRRWTLTCMAATIAVFGVATSFVSSLEWLLVTRSFVAFGLGGLTVPFCTLSEFLPPSERGSQLTFVQVFWTLGSLLVHLILRNQDAARWRQIALWFAAPSVLAAVLGFMLIPESPRWLLAKNRQEEALAILRSAAKVNGQDPINLFPVGTVLYSHEPQESFSSVFNLCLSGWIKIVSALWTTYFGMAFLDHGTVSLAVSVFANDDRQQDYQAIFNAASECLGLWVVLFVIENLGRSKTQCFFYALGGFMCLALSLLEDYDQSVNPNLLLVLTFLAHSFMFGGTCATWVSTTEVLATEMRTTGHATANIFARIGEAISSYLLSKMYSLPAVGLLLFVVSLWTACTAGTLPETHFKEMGVVHYPPVHRRRRRQCS